MFHELLKLHPHRIGGLGGDGFEATVNVVAGAHGTGEQVDSVGKLMFEFRQPFGARQPDVGDRNRADEKGQEKTQQEQLHSEESE